MTSGRDLPALVRWAREAEDAGFDSVMISEHIVLGPAAGADGVMPNPREYALPGNQDPATPWPSSLVLLSAIGPVGLAVTTNLNINFLRKGQPGQDVLAAARLLKLGKRLAVGEVSLLSGTSPDPVAHVTATYSIPNT